MGYLQSSTRRLFRLSAAILLGSSIPPPALAADASNLGPAVPDFNFADPSLTWAGGKWWSFATATLDGSIHIQAASSSDYVHWSVEKNKDGSQYDALPDLPSWVNKSNTATWAPSVAVLDDGSYVMYYSAGLGLPDHTQKHCMGAAMSKTIRGPYKPTTDILVCPDNTYGVMGPYAFKDWDVKGNWTVPAPNSAVDHNSNNSFLNPKWSRGGQGGKTYLLYKIQNADLKNSDSILTPIMLQELAADGVTKVGDPVKLLDNNGAADAFNIEAPNLFKTPDKKKYMLAFSTGLTTKPGYTVSYAIADKLKGPYVRQGVLLETGDYDLKAPGSEDILFDGKHMVFHGVIGPIKKGESRAIYAGLVSINDTAITIDEA